jgi:hypothetical protein
MGIIFAYGATVVGDTLMEGASLGSVEGKAEAGILSPVPTIKSARGMVGSAVGIEDTLGIVLGATLGLELGTSDGTMLGPELKEGKELG